MASFGYYEDEEVVDEVDELEIDDSLSSLEKIKKYTYSDIILHRFSFLSFTEEILIIMLYYRGFNCLTHLKDNLEYIK